MLEKINICGEIMTVLRNLDYSLDVTLAMEDIITIGVILLKIILSQKYSTLGNRTQNRVSNKPILYKMTAEVVTESMRKAVNMSVISVITIMLLKVGFIFTSRVNLKDIDMNVINVNTKQHLRVILLNINRQSMKE